MFAYLKAFLRRFLNKYINWVKSYCTFSFDLFLKVIWICSILLTIFWASVIVYILFYLTFMPYESVKGPINLTYRDCDAYPKPCRSNYPTADVVLTDDPNWNFYFARGQYYEFSVELHVPESPANQKVGMFIVYIALNSDKGAIDEGKQSTMLRYKSDFVRTISTVVNSPLLLYGLAEEKQVLKAKVIPNFQENKDNPISNIRIEIQSKQLDIYEAHLIINAKFSGLRYLMFHYPLSSFLVGILSIMNFLISITAVVFYHFYQYDKKKMIFSGLRKKNTSFQASELEEIDIPESKVIDDNEEDKTVGRLSTFLNESDKMPMTSDDMNDSTSSSSIENLRYCGTPIKDEKLNILKPPKITFLEKDSHLSAVWKEGANDQLTDDEIEQANQLLDDDKSTTADATQSDSFEVVDGDAVEQSVKTKAKLEDEKEEL